MTRYRALAVAAPLAAVSLIALAPGLAAQQSPGSFSLPQPTPSPTPVPQGPVDERAGVPIAPRVIQRETPEPAPTNAPARQSPPAPSTDTPRPQETQQQETRSQDSRGPARQRVQPEPQPPREPASEPAETARPVEPSTPEFSNDSDAQVAQPGFESLTLPGEDPATIGADRGTGMAERAGSRALLDGGEAPVPVSPAQDGGQRWVLLAAIALLLSLIAGIVWLAWRGRRSSNPDEAGARRLLTNVSQAIAERMPAAFPDTPLSGQNPASMRSATSNPVAGSPLAGTGARPDARGAAMAEPARIDLKLAIVTATRSMRMLSIECRIDVANRSDRAVRNLSVFAQLDTARQNSGEPGARTRENPIGSIERIGPQQGSAIVITLQKPLSEVHPIRQGNEPLFVPLVHLAIDGDNGIARSQSFVLGTSSTTNQGRLHPLPLNAVPGSIPGLKVQPIRKQPLREAPPKQVAAETAGPRSPVMPR